MREFIRYHVAGRHALQAIVSNGGCCVQRFFHVAGVELDAALCGASGLCGVVSPDAGVAVGLQLYAHRALVGIAVERLAIDHSR